MTTECKCVCCGETFPEGEGQLGDICTECGWECDETEADGFSFANGVMLSHHRRHHLTGESYYLIGKEDLTALRVYEMYQEYDQA